MMPFAEEADYFLGFGPLGLLFLGGIRI